MTVKVHIPTNFALLSLPARLRHFAGLYRAMPGQNPNIIADLEEAATEIELSERTRLTYRGGDLR